MANAGTYNASSLANSNRPYDTNGNRNASNSNLWAVANNNGSVLTHNGSLKISNRVSFSGAVNGSGDNNNNNNNNNSNNNNSNGSHFRGKGNSNNTGDGEDTVDSYDMTPRTRTLSRQSSTSAGDDRTNSYDTSNTSRTNSTEEGFSHSHGRGGGNWRKGGGGEGGGGGSAKGHSSQNSHGSGSNKDFNRSQKEGDANRSITASAPSKKNRDFLARNESIRATMNSLNGSDRSQLHGSGSADKDSSSESEMSDSSNSSDYDEFGNPIDRHQFSSEDSGASSRHLSLDGSRDNSGRPKKKKKKKKTALDYVDEVTSLPIQLLLVLMVSIFILYPGLIYASFSIFACLPVDDSTSTTTYPTLQMSAWVHGYWVRNMDQPCYHGQHQRYWLPLGVASVLVFCVGPPLGSLIVVLRNRKKLDELNTLMMFGFLYKRYRSSYYYWETMIQMQTTFLVLVDVFGRTITAFQQSLTLALVLLIISVVNMVVAPLQHRIMTILEFLSLITLAMTVCLGLFFVDVPGAALQSDSMGSNVVGVMVVLLNVGFVTFVLYTTFKTALPKLQTFARRDWKRSRLRFARRTQRWIKRNLTQRIHHSKVFVSRVATEGSWSIKTMSKSFSRSLSGGFGFYGSGSESMLMNSFQDDEGRRKEEEEERKGSSFFSRWWRRE